MNQQKRKIPREDYLAGGIPRSRIETIRRLEREEEKREKIKKARKWK